jgi:hypothetical protein
MRGEKREGEVEGWVRKMKSGKSRSFSLHIPSRSLSLSLVSYTAKRIYGFQSLT